MIKRWDLTVVLKSSKNECTYEKYGCERIRTMDVYTTSSSVNGYSKLQIRSNSKFASVFLFE